MSGRCLLGTIISQQTNVFVAFGHKLTSFVLERREKKRPRLSLCPTPQLAVTAIKPYQGGTKPQYLNTIGYKKNRYKNMLGCFQPIA